jgi:hypothetical protein
MCWFARMWFWDVCGRWKENGWEIFPCLHWKVVSEVNWSEFCLYLLWYQSCRKNLFKSRTSYQRTFAIFALFYPIKLESFNNTSLNKSTKHLNQGTIKSLNQPKYCHFFTFRVISRQISWDLQLPLSPRDFRVPSLFSPPSSLHTKILFLWNNSTQRPVSSILSDFNGWEASNIVPWWEKKYCNRHFCDHFRHGSFKSEKQNTHLFPILSPTVFSHPFVFIGWLLFSFMVLLFGTWICVEIL